MYLIRIETIFDSGHRLLDYDGKCAYPHGHTYRAEIFLRGDALDELGLVFDFTELKRRVNRWIDANWDHAFLVNSRDRELVEAFSRLSQVRLFQFAGENPSCEVMARELYRVITEQCALEPAKVRLWESANQYAEYGREELS